MVRTRKNNRLINKNKGFSPKTKRFVDRGKGGGKGLGGFKGGAGFYDDWRSQCVKVMGILVSQTDPILKTLPTTLELAEKEFLDTYARKVKPSAISKNRFGRI